MERLGKVKMDYVKPAISRVDLDKNICADDCMKIEQIFSGSGRVPTGMNIEFNIQCGGGGYNNITNNLHAIVRIAGDGVSEYKLESGGTWTICAVEAWKEGYNKCEYQLDGVGGCSYTSPLQVKRNGVWETVDINWYGPQRDRWGNVTFVPYDENAN